MAFEEEKDGNLATGVQETKEKGQNKQMLSKLNSVAQMALGEYDSLKSIKSKTIMHLKNVKSFPIPSILPVNSSQIIKYLNDEMPDPLPSKPFNKVFKSGIYVNTVYIAVWKNSTSIMTQRVGAAIVLSDEKLKVAGPEGQFLDS